MNNKDFLLKKINEISLLTKPIKLIHTKKGVNVISKRITINPCPKCKGFKKTKCKDCNGKGRVNYTNVNMLPSGIYPNWCGSCRGSGLWNCEQCFGTGYKREKIGFRLNLND